MVTIPKAVDAIVKAAELPKADVEYRARYLRDNGLLPKGKRGGGKFAAQLKAEHLATLLLSTIASAEQTRVVEMTPRLMQSTVAVLVGAEYYPPDFEDAMASEFPRKSWERQPLGAVVAKLIEMASRSETWKVVSQYLVGVESSLVRGKNGAAIILKDRKQPLVKITKLDGTLIEKVKLKPKKSWLYYGENEAKTRDWVVANLVHPNQFALTAFIGNGVFEALGDLLNQDFKEKNAA